MQTVKIGTNAEFSSALADRKWPGTWLLAPGEYEGARTFEDARRLTIKAADPTRKPVIVGAKGRANGLEFYGGRNVSLKDLVLDKVVHTGLLFAPGREADLPWQDQLRTIHLDGLEVYDVGYNAIKLVWIDRVWVRNCTFRDWSRNAINAIGCVRGRIQGCKFGPCAKRQKRVVLLKAGCRDWRLVGNRVHRRTVGTGGRYDAAFVIGGYSNPRFFWPPQTQDLGGQPFRAYEAEKVRVVGNTIRSMCPCIMCMSASEVEIDGNSLTDFATGQPVKIRRVSGRPFCREIHIRSMRE